MGLLRDSDLLRPAVELAATKADWGAPLPNGKGRGIACHTSYGQTAVAMVAEVSLEKRAVRVDRVVCAIDCGLVIHPDMAVQADGGRHRLWANRAAERPDRVRTGSRPAAQSSKISCRDYRSSASPNRSGLAMPISRFQS
jgi:hypothetical protein